MIKRLLIFDMKKIFILLTLILSTMPGYAQLYDLVVAQDGSGDYKTIQEAVYAIGDYDPAGRMRILVRKGNYQEKVVIPASKTNLSIIGESAKETVLTWSEDAKSAKGGLFQSYTLLVDAAGFECENMTIVNEAKTEALTIDVESDRVVFRNCAIKGQNTLFTGNEDSRQMYYNCLIQGSQDFVFGPATAWFEQCVLNAVSDGCYTAASTPADHPIGYVFNKCMFTADASVKQVYLGRPWRNWGAMMLKECQLPACLDPAGWSNGGDAAHESAARFYEYRNSGAGANMNQRVSWSRQVDATSAATVTLKRAFQRKGDAWATNALPTSFQRLHFAFCDEYRGKGSAYKANTLEPAKVPADPVNAVEELVIKLDSLDCTTFVEYVSAAILGRVDNPTPQDSIMQRFVQGLRYRGGKRGNYATRKHYFTEWISDNEKQGTMTDITSTLDGAVSKKKTINFMSTHPTSYPQLAASPQLVNEIKKVEEALSSTEITYLPNAKIIKNYDQIKEGDIIAFMTSTNGLDVQHVGMVWRPDPDQRPQLMHASSTNGRVVITNATIADYAYELKNCIGIKVVRLRYR